MAIITTVKSPEQFIVGINGDYNVCFESITITVADALPSGTVLKDAGTVAVSTDTDSIGILADDKPAGTQIVRVMVRGNPSLIDPAQLSVTSDTIKAALESKLMIYTK
jgi:hypothetical protein